MSDIVKRRDYRLAGPENQRAHERGLASAQWYATSIPRAEMKAMMKRKDGPAIRDTIIWLALLAGFGTLGYLSWGTWWAIPAFLAYGTVYFAPADSRWHECGHGTAFKTPWMNEVVYQFASFLIFRPPTVWRWSHARHHSDTIIVGRDPEIPQPRPPIWRVVITEFLYLNGGPKGLMRIFRIAFGNFDAEVRDYLPESEYKKAIWECRIHVLIYAIVVAACIYTGSILPAMFVILPAFYGIALSLMFGMSQHLGLHEDVLDHRLNTRTVYLNPFFRFLYWNMNYHIEHHMFPMVPYHALPKLHAAMKHDCPQPSPSLGAALKEVFTALWRQRRDPTYTIQRPLPTTAQPYYYGGHDNQPASAPAEPKGDSHIGTA